jgi:hypothetical protein
MSIKGTPHSGILYRGATGDLWFMRDDHDQATRIKNPALETLVESHLKKAAPDFVGPDLPEDIMDILNDLFGPLIGAWWVWGPGG